MEETKELRSDKESGASAAQVLNVAAYPIAAISGIAVGRESVRQSSYEMHRRNGAFDKIIAGTRDKCLAAMDKSEITGDGHARIEINEARREFKKKITGFFNKMGYENTLDHFSSISENAKFNAVVSGFTAGWYRSRFDTDDCQQQKIIC